MGSVPYIQRKFCTWILQKKRELEYRPKSVPMNEIRPMQMPQEPSHNSEEAYGRVKISGKHLKTAKVTEREIRMEDRKIKTDIKDQDFPDIPYQSYRLTKDAEKEAQEGTYLERLQKTKSLESMEKVQHRRAKTEYRSEKSLRRYEKRRIKKENKLGRLREKS